MAGMESLNKAIKTFPWKDKCHNRDLVDGECDWIAQEFLKHALVLGLSGFSVQCLSKNDIHNHYIAHFPDLTISVDFAYRVFDSECDVPLILKNEEVEQMWDLTYGWKDSLEEEFDDTMSADRIRLRQETGWFD